MPVTTLVEKRILMDAATLDTALDRMTDALVPLVSGGNACLVGIQTGGAHLARRLQARLAGRGLPTLPLGVLDITLYRDDTFLGLQQPVVRHTDVPFELSGMDVILVDDVLYTGRTIRAALDALVDFGRPRLIRLAVLVDRGLREYPIQADFVGDRTETVAGETVQVEMTEMGCGTDRVVIYVRESR
jgi:pyrimidine operon attenuation protein / uracil phosphoribosyltransferase